MRGRGNNRKGSNPLSRSYESNGPDVKIRGSAQQIADKYATLARDAQSSGDRVMAENYLQHAEHYNRIIAAAQAQQQPQGQRERDDDDDQDERDEYDAAPPQRRQRQSEPSGEERRDQQRDQQKAPARVDAGSAPQPDIEGTPAELAFGQEEAPQQQARGRRRKTADSRPRAAEPQDGGEGEQANGHANGAGEEPAEAAPAPRRTRRPRRSAANADSEAGEGDGGSKTGGSPAAEAAAQG
ncbi:DUF4167 domain-containing protein [Aquibium sp. A9E412]|uniref:DUF4167 domain-containing protein n=1 Tax=Aquibium sp. A9E412 TaxID=2976767 RepID=UPI0025B09929|nr:DUF4167 domain-containing protein [Aquibium sp. A9E412]MDN2566976.1 DUF4167 domain-containing protein [Aquibium sp. A9E412]